MLPGDPPRCDIGRCEAGDFAKSAEPSANIGEPYANVGKPPANIGEPPNFGHNRAG